MGYALSYNEASGWSYRMVTLDQPLAPGETYYPSYEAFPAEAKDWFAAHQVI